MGMWKIILIYFTRIAISTGIDIAIIGAGIGGSSAAYFLSQQNTCNKEINIDIYEASQIGGRLATLQFEGNTYEMGGSIIHEKNYYMSKFADNFGFIKNRGCDHTFGIFDGHDLIFKSSNFLPFTLARFIWRYKWDLFTFEENIKNWLDKFSRIYDINKCKNFPFSTTFELMRHTNPDFLPMFNKSTYDGFKEIGLSSMFINEVIGSIIGCNYCQSTNVHHFVGAVASAGAGAKLWSVKGGNWKVAEKLISSSKANVLLQKVLNITNFPKQNKLVVSTKLSHKLYDYVIIATPLTEKNIIFSGFDNEKPTYENMHITVCTLIKGDINGSHFKTSGESLPDIFLFTSGFTVNVISKIDPVSGNCPTDSKVWKIFSDHGLSDYDLSQIFESYSVVSVKKWEAYPHYSSHTQDRSFFIFKNVTNLLYLNAIESVASAMEMSVIGAHNVAALVERDLKKNPFIKQIQHNLHEMPEPFAHDEL